MDDLKLVNNKDATFVPYRIKDLMIGKDFLKIGGPCSVESLRTNNKKDSFSLFS